MSAATKNRTCEPKTLEERQCIPVPTPGQLLAEYLIARAGGVCSCECDLAAANLMAAGVVPEFPEFYTSKGYTIE